MQRHWSEVQNRQDEAPPNVLVTDSASRVSAFRRRLSVLRYNPDSQYFLSGLDKSCASPVRALARPSHDKTPVWRHVRLLGSIPESWPPNAWQLPKPDLRAPSRSRNQVRI